MTEPNMLGALLEDTRGVVGVVLGTTAGELRAAVGSVAQGDAGAAVAASLTAELSRIGWLLGLGELGVASLKAATASRVVAQQSGAVVMIELDPKRPLGELEAKLRALPWAPDDGRSSSVVHRAPTARQRERADSTPVRPVPAVDAGERSPGPPPPLGDPAELTPVRAIPVIDAIETSDLTPIPPAPSIDGGPRTPSSSGRGSPARLSPLPLPLPPPPLSPPTSPPSSRAQRASPAPPTTMLARPSPSSVPATRGTPVPGAAHRPGPSTAPPVPSATRRPSPSSAPPVPSATRRPGPTSAPPIPGATRRPNPTNTVVVDEPHRPSASTLVADAPRRPSPAPPPRPSPPSRPSPGARSVPAQMKSVGSGPVFTGDLEEFGLPDLLELLRNSHRTGLLMCTTYAGTGTILLSRGMIISADSPNALDLRRHFLTSPEVGPERRRVLAGLPVEWFGDDMIDGALASRELIAREDVTRARIARIYSAFREMVGWTVGRFSFDPAVPVVTNPALALSAQTILMQIYQEQDERGR